MKNRNCTFTRNRCSSKRICYAAVALILFIHALMLGYAATRHSPTLLEPGFLAAGISHWELGHFELFKVNPPLVRMVAALPVMAAGYEMDWHGVPNTRTLRPEHSYGAAFVHANRSRSVWLFVIARWAGIPFSLLGAVLCFCWSSEVWNHNGAGFVSILLWCFDPNVLAHAELITTDCAAASLGMGVAYFFWRWMKSPSYPRALLTAFMLGLALLSKTTWLIYFSALPIIWSSTLLRRTGMSSRMSWKVLRQQLIQLGAIFLLAIFLVNVVYKFEGTFTRLEDFTFVSSSLTGEKTPGTCGNYFIGTIFARVPMPLPSSYVRGIDLQKKDFEDWSAPSYLRGEWKATGWWWYYLYGLLVKMPFGTQCLLIISVINTWYATGGKEPATLKIDLLPILVPPTVVFALVSSQIEFNENFRYVLPCFGFAFVFGGGVIRTQILKPLTVACLVLTITASTLNYPHSLAFFNFLSGGSDLGFRHMLGSNLSWGQDYVLLDEWCEKNPHAAPVALYSQAMYDPSDLQLSFEDATSTRTQPSDIRTLAVDVTSLQSLGLLSEVRGSPKPDQRLKALLAQRKMVAKVGKTLYLFSLQDEAW